ncbi:MAG: hypothetical protein MUF58_17050 [Arcicella sp.]|jgi:hypothetical protein|nr:hypothetical protein [Arcicella sp.]
MEINDIKKMLNVTSNDTEELKKAIKNKLASIHPDKNGGNGFASENDKILFNRLTESLDSIDSKENNQLALIQKQNDSIIKIVETFVNTNSSKIDSENLDRKIADSIQVYKDSNLFSKITSSVISGILTIIWMFPKTFSEHPFLKSIFNFGKLNIVDSGVAEAFFSVIWLSILIFTFRIWYVLIRKEYSDKFFKQTLTLDTVQNEIFSNFIRKIYNNRSSLQNPIFFNNTHLLNHIYESESNNNVNIATGKSPISRFLYILNLPFFTVEKRIDLELAQSLTNIILNKACEKKVISKIDKISLGDTYKIEQKAMVDLLNT